MNYEIVFKLFWFQFCHINESNFYVIFLSKERNYLYLFVAIETAVLWLNEHNMKIKYAN